MFGRKDGMDMSAFGDAHFATPPEVRDENLLAPKGIRLGYYREPGKRKGWGQVIRYAGDASLTIIAGARSGKTRDFLCPALLEHEQSAIVIDPRGQLASLTKSRREQLGQDVHVLNPYRVFSETLGDPACYNPMDILDPLSPEFDSDCRKLAEGLIARDSDREGHWVSGARSLVAGIIGGLAAHGGVETKNLGYVREVLCSDTLLLKYARASQNSDHAFIRQQLASFAKADPDNPAEVAGFKETAREQTSFLGMKMIAESLRRTDFRFAGLKDKAGTVYIILPDNRLDDCGPWFRLIVASALNELWRGGRGKYRVLTILDEFAQIGHLDILENAAAAAAGRGVQLWPVLQNIPQLKKDYGEVWETFLSASDVQIFMTPREQTSADYISKWIGQRTVMTAGQSVQNSGHLGANKESDTLGQAGQPLIRPDEISKLGKHEAIIIGPHHTVIDALRRPYFHTPELEFLYDPDPLHEHDAVPAPVDPDTITTFADMLVACEERAERERLARRPLAFRLLVWGKSRNPYLNGLLKVEYFATLPLRLLLALLAAPFAIHSRPVGAALGFFALFGFWEVWNGFAKEPFLQLYDFERKTCTQQKYIDDDKWMGHELACKTEALKETASLFWSNAILTFIRSGPGVAAHRLDSVYGNEVGKWNDSVHAYSAHIAAKVTGEFDAVNAKPSSRHQFGETVALNAGAKVDFVPLSALQITEVEQNTSRYSMLLGVDSGAKERLSDDATVQYILNKENRPAFISADPFSDHGAAEHCRLVRLSDGRIGLIQATERVHSPNESRPRRDPWTDPDTGLVWTGVDSGSDLPLEDAIDYCETLDGGKAGWRLPNEGEVARLGKSPEAAGQVKGVTLTSCCAWIHADARADFNFMTGKKTYYLFDFPERRALCVRR